MKRFESIAVALFLVFLVALPSLAATPWGEVNFGLGYEWDGSEKELTHNSTLTGFRLGMEENVDFGGKIHLSIQGWRDWKTKEGKLSIDQLWLSGYSGDFDYTIGRQPLNWGTADGFNPTNYFARMDSSALLNGDLSGDPLWAAQAIYYGQNWSLTGVVVPFFTPQSLDAQMLDIMAGGNPMASLFVEAIDTVKKPRGLGKNSEWALRAETQIAGFDVQASVFSGFEALPGMELDYSKGFLDFVGEYRRQNFVGLATSGTLGPIGVWGEISYGGPTKFAETPGRIALSVNEKYLQAVLGGDYTFDLGRGLLVQGQYIYRGQGSLLAPYVMPDLGSVPLQPREIEKSHYLYGRLGYDFSPSSSVDLIVLHGFTEQSGLIRPAYTHSFPGSIQVELSLINTYGEGDLGSIPTQGRLAVKYSF